MREERASHPSHRLLGKEVALPGVLVDHLGADIDPPRLALLLVGPRHTADDGDTPDVLGKDDKGGGNDGDEKPRKVRREDEQRQVEARHGKEMDLREGLGGKAAEGEGDDTADQHADDNGRVLQHPMAGQREDHNDDKRRNSHNGRAPVDKPLHDVKARVHNGGIRKLKTDKRNGRTDDRRRQKEGQHPLDPPLAVQNREQKEEQTAEDIRPPDVGEGHRV